MNPATAVASDFRVVLHLTNPAGATKSRPVPAGEYLIGRDEKCHIRINANESRCSRQHARLVLKAEGCYVEDLETRSGTMVNGQVVDKKSLEDGDVVSVVGYFVKIELPKTDAHKHATSLFAAGTERIDDASAEELAADLKKLKQQSQAVLREMGKRIVGQHEVLQGVWATVLARGHCLLVGVPGLAKTFMVTSFAEVLGLQTKRIQFTPDLMPADIVGANVLHDDDDGKRHFHFIQGPIFCQLLLADEINRTPPKTQAALLEAMQERQVTVGNKSLSLPDPFCVIASQNPIEQEGTYPLPEAQQDRFMVCIKLDYPQRHEEIDVLLRTTGGSVSAIEQVVDFQDILQAQGLVDRIAISQEAAAYAVDLSRATRPGCPEQPSELQGIIDWGAGPRAGQALLRGAKALAAMDGRPMVARGDIRAIAPTVLRHRLGLNYRARSAGHDADTVVQLILEHLDRG